MAIYTCVGCNGVFQKRLKITYMSWYEGDELIRYRLSLCDDDTKLVRSNATDQGFKRMEDGSWLGPQAVLPGVEPSRTVENGHRTQI